jgi:hypothetical protein
MQCQTIQYPLYKAQPALLLLIAPDSFVLSSCIAVVGIALLWVYWCLFLILVHVDADVEVDSEVWFSRGRTPFLVLFAYLKRARLCMRIPGFSVE